jgi:hypothetical protein
VTAAEKEGTGCSGVCVRGSRRENRGEWIGLEDGQDLLRVRQLRAPRAVAGFVGHLPAVEIAQSCVQNTRRAGALRRARRLFVFAPYFLLHLANSSFICLSVPFSVLAWIYNVQLSWSIPVSGVVDMHALCW